MQTLHVEQHDQVAVIKLNRGVTNAINLELVNELSATLHELQDDPAARSLVLSSSNAKFFSIGFDIPHLFGLSRDDFWGFYRAFNRLSLDLYTFPKPTVAALTGHAIAGGCILALCCDYRLVAQGRKLMSLNEVRLGVPVPYPADCVLRQLVGAREAREVMESGEFYAPQEALRKGMVDQVWPVEQVLAEAIAKACSLGAMPAAALALIKRNRVEEVEAQVLARLEEKERFFIECWYAGATRERLREAMKKF